MVGRAGEVKSGMLVGMLKIFMLAALLTIGCAEDAPFEDCSLGELRGTWRQSFNEIDGTCGPIPDSTTLFTDDTEIPENCTINARTISDDKCRLDYDITCVDGNASLNTVSSSRQVSASKIEGTDTLHFENPANPCRSTYETTMTRL